MSMTLEEALERVEEVTQNTRRLRPGEAAAMETAEAMEAVAKVARAFPKMRDALVEVSGELPTCTRPNCRCSMCLTLDALRAAREAVQPAPAPDDLGLPVGGPVRSDLERAYERIRELNAELQRAKARPEVVTPEGAAKALTVEHLVELYVDLWRLMTEQRERAEKAEGEGGKLRDALGHMQCCRPCAEGSWESCDGGRAALELLRPAPAEVKPS